MTAKDIITDISEETGWDADSKIHLLCDFIDKFNDPSLLATFLKQCQVEENEVFKEDAEEQEWRDRKNGLYGDADFY